MEAGWLVQQQAVHLPEDHIEMTPVKLEAAQQEQWKRLKLGNGKQVLQMSDWGTC